MEAVITRTINCFGVSKAHVAARIGDFTAVGREPSVAIICDQDVIRVRIVARGGDLQSVRTTTEKQAAVIRHRLGELVFGEDEQTLAEAVAELLIQHRTTVATAESCTGGLLAKMFTDIPGSSAYFIGGYVAYANEAKVSLIGVPEGLIERHGAVSEEVARSMAQGCCRATGAACALSTTGIAGPGGGSTEKPVGLVYIGLADADGCKTQRCQFDQHLDRSSIRDRSCKAALNLLRLRLLALTTTNRP